MGSTDSVRKYKKFEAQNSKYETSPKSEFLMFKTQGVPKVYP